MRHVFDFLFAFFFFSLAILAFICAKEDTEHNIISYLMGVAFGLYGIMYICKE